MNWLTKVLNFKRGELTLGSLAALFHFCVLCGYFFLRPVREGMGVSRGLADLRWLFVVTSLSSLVIVFAFGGVVSRLNRRRFIPIGYFFVIVCLGVFSTLLIHDANVGGGIIGTDAETAVARGVGYTYYVWLSVINLFVISLFWAFMVDVFSLDQGKRMFAFIGIGGTLGAIVGSGTTTWISKNNVSDSLYLPAVLMLIGAALFGAAIVTMLTLDRVALRSTHSSLSKGSPAAVHASAQSGAIGGTFWDGAAAVVRSPYLLGIGAYIVLMAISNTMIYFTQAIVVLGSTDTLSERIGSFAQLDMLAQIATLITQMFITT